MNRMLKRLIRASGFVTKEINEVRRQPRLILSLILGPFAILFLFGIGYQGESTRLSALIVIPKSGAYSQKIEDYRKLVGEQLTIRDITTDEAAAVNRLKQRDVDLVIVVPEDASKQISSGAQVRVPIYFNEVDPLRRDAITYLSFLYINEINKQTVAAIAGQGQQNAGDVRSAISRMRNTLGVLEARLGAGDITQANSQVKSMQSSSANVQLAVGLLSQFLATDTTLVKPPAPQDPNQVNISNGSQAATRLSTDLQSLDEEFSSASPDPQRARERIARVRTDLDTLDKVTQQFQTINPLVLASPFYPLVENKAPVNAGFTSFYSPGVLVLLLQHIAITLAALSMVRERLLGTVELFRVSPVSPGEIMAGKYAGFLLLLGAISSVLLLMMSNEFTVGGVRLSLGVPILGDWVLLIVSLALVTFASIGLGMFISAISKSESQAVQLSMLVLLASVFFSGFFLRLEAIWPPVQALSYALPVTYGIQSLQVVMLRGGIPTPTYWIGDVPFPAILLALFALGMFFALLSYILFRREFKRQ